jgi:hypothetical protein
MKRALEGDLETHKSFSAKLYQFSKSKDLAYIPHAEVKIEWGSNTPKTVKTLIAEMILSQKDVKHETVEGETIDSKTTSGKSKQLLKPLPEIWSVAELAIRNIEFSASSVAHQPWEDLGFLTPEDILLRHKGENLFLFKLARKLTKPNWDFLPESSSALKSLPLTTDENSGEQYMEIAAKEPPKLKTRNKKQNIEELLNTAPTEILSCAVKIAELTKEEQGLYCWLLCF